MRFAHRLLKLTTCTSPLVCVHVPRHLDRTHFVVGLADVVDSRSALQAEGLGFDPRQRHEPHKLNLSCIEK